ncbi:MAG: MFS transporter [Anaerolineae bacterium]|nr:MFS transporter [Anaerolineae bacterium]
MAQQEKQPKQKKQYPEDFKTMFGVSVMGLSQLLPNSLIAGYLILYITDYAGIYTGIAGKAAAVATAMLLIGRIWDAINDPLMGFLMDRAPRRKQGKFKPILLFGTVLSTILIIALFNIPAGLPDIAKIVWLYFFYFLFDTAFTLMPINPLTQTLTDDANVRSKLLAAPRIVTLVVATGMSGFLAIAIALGPDGVTPNFGLATFLVMLPLTIISLVGIILVKEGKGSVEEGQVTVKDALAMFRVNKPLLYSMIGYLFGGFIFNIFTTASVYYIKYAFGAENLGTISAITGGLMILTIIIGTFASRFLIKRLTPGMAIIIAYAIAGVGLLILFLINLTGPITSLPLYIGLIVLVFLGNSLAYLPWQVTYMECMDYNKYRLGKSMQAMVGSTNAFISKLQAAIGAALTGAVLVAIGYDAALYENAANIPESLFSGLGFVLFALPAIFAALSVVSMFFYPLLKQEKRDAMYAEIGAAKSAAVTETAEITPA